MKKKLLLPTLALALAGAGCHSSAALAHGENTATTPAPFASPPVLSGTPDVATLVAKVKPSVVNITTTRDVRLPHVANMPDLGEFGFPGLPFFGSQRGPGVMPNGEGGEGQTLHEQALGSGIIFDSEGHIVTNAHVVDDADRVKVRLADDREYAAKVIGKDKRIDVAVLKLENPPHDLPVASLGSSEALRVGEYVVAIGNPFGLGDTVTMGIVSAKGRSIGAGPYDDFIQTDASINPGNSGGALFDLRGQVIGINTAINPEGKGIGFAIPIDLVKEALPQLIATGHVSRGQIGVRIQGIDPAIATALGMDHAHGALVEEVEPGSPAQRAGIEDGDVIVSVDGKDVPRSSDLPRMIASHAPGATVNVKVMRDKQLRSFAITLDALKDETASDASGNDSTSSAPSSGIVVGDRDGRAVVEGVQRGSAADGIVSPGDVIVEVNRKPVTDAAGAAAALRATPAGTPLLLKVKHGDTSRFVAIEKR